MQTNLAPEFKDLRAGTEAEAIVRRCVHCGFCTATCPTYQLLGDELDGPRGRIYLIKQMLEGAPVTRSTQQHLDRCLTCRNCETTCPSGVEYGRLIDIGRELVEARVPRPQGEQALRWLLKTGLTSPAFAPALKLGQALRPLLPRALKAKVPPRAGARAHRWPTRSHPRKVLLLLGCVQPALLPNINSATARVLDAAGIQTLVADEARCCGALRTHLGDGAGGLADMRRNIDAWWPLVTGVTEHGKVEAIVVNASGCGVAVKDYGHALAHDAAYADKARRVAELARDLSELLPDIAAALRGKLRAPKARRLAFHPPCTLQHGQRLRGGVESHLRELGFEVEIAAAEAHLCCGSAGTYSILQGELATALRDRKLAQLQPLDAQAIVSANIGCIQHLQSGTTTPVMHWVEALDEVLND
ncbi:MAG: glycolate oxidase subunit GlcF [Burkholderiales bacterium]|nr:glycolate oxidase subunit GlcF [Burkholderiales bacterium]MDE1927889.1 glycolate oxidase subunit GlcF [Burkholderiales bacterium]MDE2158639.1 glycolate oxidase subunit GlcF [Burkholderiales bacterium]MDE2501924.1 glycolate oxidase subunit GlcF [Burkholderiales bacterium]